MINMIEDIMTLHRKRQLYKKWFDELVAGRDGWKCRKCESTRAVSAHHITPPDSLPVRGNSIYNAIMLCLECRKIVKTGKNECYAPEVLYALISSSKEKAIEDLDPRKKEKFKSDDK